MAIKNNLALQLIPVLLDVVVLHHNHHHIYLIEELVKIQNLVLHNLFLSEEGIKGLQRTSEVVLLNVEYLKSEAFTDVFHIHFI